MGQKMTWDEIKDQFPNEWVALVNYERTSAIGVKGTLIVHNSNKKEFHITLRTLLPAYRDVAVRYTGQLIKNPEIPLLWQIMNTNSTGN